MEENSKIRITHGKTRFMENLPFLLRGEKLSGGECSSTVVDVRGFGAIAAKRTGS